jgi:hypothetical protein
MPDEQKHVCYDISTGNGGQLYAHCNCGVAVKAKLSDVLVNKFVQHAMNADAKLEVDDADDEDDEPD